MKYLLLVYGDEQILNAMTPEEGAAIEQACLANDEVLRQRGQLIAIEAPQVNVTSTVRVQQGNVSVTDGPFIETKEQLMGIFFLNAADFNEAIQIASAMPQARCGPIEVRPLMELDEMPR